MSVSMRDVRKVLDPEEPDYAAAARLGIDSLPHLRRLVAGDDPLLAAKAAYAAGQLAGDTGQDVVTTAAHSDDPTLRVAAAGAAASLPPESAAVVLSDLVGDDDPGVRKVALASVPADPPTELADRIQQASLAPQAVSAEPVPNGEQPLGTMPGERADSGLMPGEGPTTGLMPGEGPGTERGMGDAGIRPKPGKMPGEE